MRPRSKRLYTTRHLRLQRSDTEDECMLQHAIDVGDKQEIAFLRSEIQHVKAEKRNIKRMMKNRMEPALT